MIFCPASRSKKGFTFVEILVTMAIIVITLSIAVPNLIQYRINYEMTGLNDKARILFLAAQNHLITVKNKGELPALVQNLPGLTDEDIDAASRPADWAENRDNLVYLQLNQDGTGDAVLRDILKPYLQDVSILEHNITVEFNKKTGMVASVIYSERANSLAYRGTDSPGGDGVNISVRTQDALRANRLGFYGNADTGKLPENLQKPTVTVENNDQLRLVWTDCEPSGSSSSFFGDNIVYTVKIMSPDGATTYLALSGIQRGDLTLSPINSEIETDLTDLAATGTPTPGSTHTIIYQDGQFSLILDKIDTIHNDNLFGQSIFYRYPSIPMGNFIARVEASAPGSPVKYGDSAVSHSYFAEEDANGVYKIAYARHLSNMRYLNTAGKFFEQIKDIDWNDVALLYGSNDCPVSFTPVSHHYRDVMGNLVSNHFFAGSYQGNHFALRNFVISDTASSPSGLFRVLNGERAALSNMTLDSFTVTAKDTAGILAGEISAQDTDLNNMTSCNLIDSSLTVTLDEGVQAMTGGLVGRNGGSIGQSSLTDCAVAFQGEKVADADLGGVVGYNGGEITEVTATGITVSGNSYTGGFAGFNAGDMASCSVEEGTVSYLGYYSGGFAGASQGSVTACHAWDTTVSPGAEAVAAPGGIGGFVGLASGTLADSYVFQGSVTLQNGSSVGGFAGSTSSALTDCYASATYVQGSGSVYVGGFAGSNSGSILRAYVNHKYMTGGAYAASVIGGTWVGGFAGANSGSIAEAYNNAIPSAVNGMPAGFAALNSGSLLRSYFLTGSGYNVSVADTALGKSFSYMTSTAMTDAFNDAGHWLFDPANADPTDYPYPTIAGLKHYGEWPQAVDPAAIPDGRYFAYYEIYADGTLGIYGTTDNSTFVDTLSDTKTVAQEGYGVVFAGEPNPNVNRVSIRIDSTTAWIYSSSFLTVRDNTIAALPYDFMEYNGPGNHQFSHATVSIDNVQLVKQTRCNLLFGAALGPNSSWNLGQIADAPYQIRSPRHLLNIGWYDRYLDEYFSQTTNIDYAVYTRAQSGSGVDPYYHYPIGSWGWGPFEGQYDGLGNTIAHLTISATNPANSGLFGVVAYGGVLKNIRLTDASLNLSLGWTTSLSSSSGFGVLAGYVSGSSRVENCGVIGGVINQTLWDTAATVRLGGLVGNNYGAITQSFATCTVNAEGSACGGLVGDNNYGAIITKSYANSPLMTMAYGIGGYNGGFVGWNEGSISDCYSVSGITATDYSGGFVGVNTNGGQIMDCYSLGSISGQFGWHTEVGGFAGENSWNASIQNAYFLQDTDYNTGLSAIGYSANSGAQATAKSFYQLTFLSTVGYPGFDFSNTWDEAAASDTFPLAAALNDENYPYAWIKGVPHYGDWPVWGYEGSLAYFENYTDATKGVCFVKNGAIQNDLDDAKIVSRDGYGILVKHDFTNAANASVKIYDGNGASLLLQASGVEVSALSHGISLVKLSDTSWLDSLPTSSTGYYVAECFVNGISAGKVRFNPHFAGALSADSSTWSWGTQSNPYLIRSPYQLRNIGLSRYLGKYYQQTADISYTDYSEAGGAGVSNYHTAIGSQALPFTGQYDGGSKNIIGLDMDINHDYGGLFGYSTGTLQNIRIAAGGSAAIMPTGGNTAYGKTGALAGYNGGTVANCSAAIPVMAHDTVGGLIGWNAGTVTGCFAGGNVTGTADAVGGLAGKNTGIVQTSSATGSIVGDNNTGGFAGYAGSGAQMTKCYATGAVTAASAAGGFLGSGASGATISKCYATGNVTGNASIGGFFGESQGYAVDNCYATGKVTQIVSGSGSSLNFGGFGGILQSGTVTKCYAAGKVSATASGTVGGFLGYGSSASLTRCYFLGNGSTLYNYINSSTPFYRIGNVSSTSGILSVNQMKNKNYFSYWDFYNIWEMNTDDSTPAGYPYPKLRGVTHDGAWPTTY